jgi:alcohol dehydrogenase (cytochrome c)
MFQARVVWLSLLVSLTVFGQTQGYRTYETTCVLCHGSDGTGGEFGPNISVRLPKLDDEQLTALIHSGLSRGGMPAFPNIQGQKLSDLLIFLRSVKPREAAEVKLAVLTNDGRTLDGVVLNRSNDDLELQTPDKAIHLLRRSDGTYREVTSSADWTSYNGDLGGNRLTRLTQIDKSNVSHLAPKWMFSIPDAASLETTPVVMNGIMYVTTANQCYALDAGNGRMLWHFERPPRKGIHGGVGINRGVALSGDRVFMVSDDAHMLALNRFNGDLEWDTQMADWHDNYFATSAPLAVGNLVISGTAGGEHGVRGFLAAFDQASGKEVWRFWNVPAAGEPKAETWGKADLKHAGAVSWFTGSYDAETDTLYWQTGNPGPDYNGAQREGDNLYSDCVLALNPKTGNLKWYYQFTPHDTHDWDASEPIVVADADWQGQPRQLLFMANRNGFFYVLDRTDGKLLLARPFVKKMNWASEIGADGRPVLKDVTKQVCPSQDGATNWYSTSYLPSTGMYFLQTLEKCDIYTQSPAEWQSGDTFLGGSRRPVAGEIPEKVLRAIDTKTGNIVWEMPEAGPANSWGGTLATQTGLLFVADDSGRLMAVEAANGKPLWSFEANQPWKASPMAYEFDGHEYIGIASGQTVIIFGLAD